MESNRSRVVRWFLPFLVVAISLLTATTAFSAEGGGNNVSYFNSVWTGVGAGLVTSLTPCVYPMIAITVSVFGARQTKSRGQAMALSTAFLFGMITFFTALFVLAALGGTFLQNVLQNKWFFVGTAIVFIAMAASMFGAFEMKLPDSLMQRLSGVGGTGYGGAFTLGLVTGPLATPCAGPILTPMTIVVAERQSVPLGATTGVSYGLGLGVLFWVVGSFAAGLPKGGRWMMWVKSGCGVIMLVLSLYYLHNVFPTLDSFGKNETKFLAITLAVGVLGLAIGAIHIDWSDGGIGTKLRKASGIAAATIGAFLFIMAIRRPKEVSAEELAEIQRNEQAKAEANKQEKESRVEQLTKAIASESDPTKKAELEAELVEAQKEAEAAVKLAKVYPPLPLHWPSDLEKAKAQAKEEGRPLIIDFGATWCEACKELEKHTFADAAVMAKAGRFVVVRVDASTDDDPKVVEVKKAYGVSGLPAVILIDSTGKEVDRFSKFIKADEFLKRIEPIM